MSRTLISNGEVDPAYPPTSHGDRRSPCRGAGIRGSTYPHGVSTLSAGELGVWVDAGSSSLFLWRWWDCRIGKVVLFLMGWTDEELFCEFVH